MASSEEYIDYDLCITGLKVSAQVDICQRFKSFLGDLLGNTNILRRVEYDGHQVIHREEERAIYVSFLVLNSCLLLTIRKVRLKFNGERFVSQRNLAVVYEFCIKLFEPDAEEAFLPFSKYGVLGCSAANNDFGRSWNLIAVDCSLLRGQEMLNAASKKLNRYRWPMWYGARFSAYWNRILILCRKAQHRLHGWCCGC